MYTIIYRDEAEDDLLEILAYYYSQGGFELVQIIENKIKNHILKLKTFPYRTKESEVFPNTREYIIESLPYKAFLRIDEEQKTVVVFNIVHFSRKFP